MNDIELDSYSDDMFEDLQEAQRAADLDFAALEAVSESHGYTQESLYRSVGIERRDFAFNRLSAY